MPRWVKVVRGMIGTGLTFSAGVGAVTGTIATLVWLFRDDLTLSHLPGVLGLAARPAVIAFPVGVAFSGVLALVARRRQFRKLSVPLFASLGAGAGILLFLLLGFNGAFKAWSTTDAIVNFAILALLGGGAATATLLVARRAKPELDASDDQLGASDHVLLSAPNPLDEVRDLQAERPESVRP